MSIVCTVCLYCHLSTYLHSPHSTVVPVAGGDKEESGEAGAESTHVPHTPELGSKGVPFPKGTTGQPTPAKAEE